MCPTKKIGTPGKSGDFEDVVDLADLSSFFPTLLDSSDDNPIPGMSFEEFVQKIFSKSYPNYDFDTWHIRKICQRIDQVLAKPNNRFFMSVLPRGHLKSTIVGDAAFIYRMLTGFGDGLYLSVKTELAEYHLSNIKAAIRNNEFLSRKMVDLRKESDTGICYKVGSKRMRIFAEGILSAQRGRHFDLLAVADDVQGDLANPLITTELDKAKRLFRDEVIPTLNPGCPMFFCGTVMSEDDLIYELRKNPLFDVLWMPAINPDPEHEVLWEKRFPKEALDDIKTLQQNWKSFSTEYLLVPLSQTEAFLSRSDLEKVINSSLQNYKVPGW
jgi:hypothetical protein